MNLAVFILAALVAALVCGAFGWVFERLIVKPVYGQHLKQILATIGGAIIAEQLLYAVFGPARIPLSVPKTFEGSFVFGEAAIEKYRVLATLVGLAVFLSEMLILNRTKIGLLVRAGVENREMVEALGYRVDRLFVAVFMAGSALAGLGGAMMALYRGQVHGSIGGEFLVLCFIVIIIGGSGSVGGSFVASILVALIANYTGFLVLKLALCAEHPGDGRGAAVGDPARSTRSAADEPAFRRPAARARAASSARPHRPRLGVGAIPVPGRQGAQRRRQDLRDDPARRVL